MEQYLSGLITENRLVEESSIDKLTKEIEKKLNTKISWELGGKRGNFEATCEKTGALVALYNPKSGKLTYTGNQLKESQLLDEGIIDLAKAATGKVKSLIVKHPVKTSLAILLAACAGLGIYQEAKIEQFAKALENNDEEAQKTLRQISAVFKSHFSKDITDNKFNFGLTTAYKTEKLLSGISMVARVLQPIGDAYVVLTALKKDPEQMRSLVKYISGIK